MLYPFPAFSFWNPIKKSEEPTVLTKSGYDMIPYIYNFIPKEVNTINVYAEIYNTDKVFGTDQKFY